MERKAGASSKDDPPQDDNRASRAAPNTTVEQAELLHTDSNAGFFSVGCFSVTFPKSLEGTSTMDTHPFQTVGSTTPLTIKHQQSHHTSKITSPGGAELSLLSQMME